MSAKKEIETEEEKEKMTVGLMIGKLASMIEILKEFNPNLRIERDFNGDDLECLFSGFNVVPFNNDYEECSADDPEDHDFVMLFSK